MSAPQSDQLASTGEDLAHQKRKAPAVKVGSWDREARTFDAILSTGAAVERRSYSLGQYTETLEISAKAINLSRFAAGMSLLDSHDAYSLNSRVGTIVPGSVRIENGKLVATAKLSRNAKGEALAIDLDDGHGLQLSIGYQIDRYDFQEATAERGAVLSVTRWTPHEVSVVNIPADPGSHSRSFQKDYTMGEESDLLTSDNAGTSPPAMRVEPRVPRVMPKAPVRRSFAARFGLTGDDLNRLVDDTEGKTEQEVRQAVQSAIVDIQEQTAVFPHMSTRGLEKATGGTVVKDLTDVLLGRSARSGLDVARDYLASQGQRAVSDRDVARQVFGGSARSFGGMHTTSDFNILTAEAAQGALLERFNASPSALKQLSRKRNATDFRPQGGYRLGEAPALLRVGEHGEIKNGTLAEEKNLFAIDTYARIFALTMQASVNDSLGAFADFLANFAESAIALEGDLFASLLATNGYAGPVLSDGVPTFHAKHGNLAPAGSVLGVETIAAGALAMRLQRNVSGNGPAGTAPAFLIVGPRMEAWARQLGATIVAAKASDTNPFASELTVVVEDRFGGDFLGWYLVASPDRRAAFVHGTLEQAGEGPSVDSREGWRILGTEYRVVHHFGCGINDFRAIYYNPGAEPTP